MTTRREPGLRFLGPAGGTPRGAAVYRNTLQAAANDTLTALSFTTVRWDSDKMFDSAASTQRLTCRTAGVYVISAHVEFATNATGERTLYLRLNGTTYIAVQRSNAVAASPHQMSVARVWELAAGDYVEALVRQNSGVSLNVGGASTAAYGCEFAAVLQ